MGASDSKLVFKKGIFRLSQERHVPVDDPYWTSFWELPESAEDIFALFSPNDIRRTRDHALENLETLILSLTSRLFALRHHPAFPDPELAPERDALNCIRILTRTLPFLFEAESLSSWHDHYFWGGRRKRTRKEAGSEVLFDEEVAARGPGGEDAEDKDMTLPDEFDETKPLAEELIDTLVDLLFFAGFTLIRQHPGKPKVSYSIWQSGVGCNTASPTTKEFESNRCEVLRLLLTLGGQSMYMTPATLPLSGVKALTYICTCADKQIVLSMLCSLLNTTLKYNPATWKVPYNTLMFKDPKQVLVTYTLQFLLAMLLYPIPESRDDPTPTGSPPKNYYRHFLGRLHRPQDFQFIVDGMTRILNQPLQEKTSYLPGAQSAAADLAPDILMLFWEMTQCNRRFRSFIIDTERAHDFVILALFYALDFKAEGSKQGVVRMCAFLLQTLSVEKNFGINLNKLFDGQDTLPPTIKIVGFRGTYADFLIQSIYNLISTSQGKLSAIYPALLAVINNIAPYLEGLSMTTSSTLLQLFSYMSSPSFMLANDTNHSLLRALLESINSIVEHKYQKNPEFVFAVLKNRKRIEALRSFTLESGLEEMERRSRRRKEAVGADPKDFASTSVRNSVDNPTSPASSGHNIVSPGAAPDEDGIFAIGDDDDDDEDGDGDDDDHRPTPTQSTASEHASQQPLASSVEDAVPMQIRGMSEKARGKLPAGVPPFSRQNSTTSIGGYSSNGQSADIFEPSLEWIESWLPELPLHTLLTMMQQVSALLPRQAVVADFPSRETLLRIQEIRPVTVDPAPPRIHSFEWSPLALGWYESLLWGLIFSSEMQVAARGTVGVWNGTAIRLFRVQETAPEGPTLTSPRGAVDAVGSNIVSRIGAMNLRGHNNGGGGAGTPASPGTPRHDA